MEPLGDLPLTQPSIKSHWIATTAYQCFALLSACTCTYTHTHFPKGRGGLGCENEEKTPQQKLRIIAKVCSQFGSLPNIAVLVPNPLPRLCWERGECRWPMPTPHQGDPQSKTATLCTTSPRAINLVQNVQTKENDDDICRDWLGFIM